MRESSVSVPRYDSARNSAGSRDTSPSAPSTGSSDASRFVGGDSDVGLPAEDAGPARSRVRFPAAYDGSRDRSSGGSRVPSSVGTPTTRGGSDWRRGDDRGTTRPDDGGGSRDLGGVLDRYGSSRTDAGAPSGPGRTYSSGPGSRVGSRDDGPSTTRPGETDRTSGGLRNVGGARNVRASEGVRAQPGGGATVASPDRTRPGDGANAPGRGTTRPVRGAGGPATIRTNPGGTVGGDYRGGGGSDVGGNGKGPSGGNGYSAGGGASTYGGSNTRGSNYSRGGVTRGVRVGHDDPSYPKGTAAWSPWGYYHRDYGVRFHFGYYCGSSYWYWNWPAYYCWYYPYRYRYWYYPAVYVPYYSNPDVVYVYDDDPEVIYVDGQGDEVFVDEPVGEGVVRGEAVAQGEGLPPEPSQPEPLNLAAERYLTLGDEAFRDGRYSDAVHFYARAIEFAPDSGVLYLVLSDALFATGDYHYAAYAIRKAFELEPELVAGSVDKHGFYEDPSQFDRQLAVLENYFADHPGDADARLVLAVNLLFGNRPADAVDLLEGAPAVRQDRRAEALVLERARSLQFGAR